MSACCNCVNKSNLQFSGHTFIYKQSVDDLTLAQFLKHVITPQNGRFSIASIRKLLIGGFRRKRNRGNTSTGGRRDSKVRFILGELFEVDNPMTGSDFDCMVSNQAVWGWKAPVKASVSGVSLLQLSPFSLPSFPLSSRNA